ncbi:hypothetical protein [Dictyobacter formicarum]|uniref:Uncharacterized protein n=1 Tax=Dictyobacter formicarum TaxID=2778368 RepID=A0ABQ3VFD9_9CHLR|nr:hypothetical protein [Dictyobacter formicarum]GHO84887.1 hypothetical protein KSZ_28930 [Dictyobacter formicarum]
MQSLLQETLQPATTALLKAIDASLNSNTMLFKVRSEQIITTSNAQEILNLFLHSPLFRDMFLEVDQLRGLLSYSTWDFIDGEPVQLFPSGNPLLEPLQLILTPMNEQSFAERLHWMLTSAESPYQKQVSEQRAQEILRDFFWEVFTPQSWPIEQPLAQQFWHGHPWSFCAVAPNFLPSTGYYYASEEYELPDFAYFDGGKRDTCTFFYSKDIFYLLLTNGSP